MKQPQIGDIVTITHYGKGEVIHLRSEREFKVRLDKPTGASKRRNIICFPSDVISFEPGIREDFQPSDEKYIQKGMIVQHRKFGRGEVLKIEIGSGDIRKGVVNFFEAGEKTLLLSFAKLQIISF